MPFAYHNDVYSFYEKSSIFPTLEKYTIQSENDIIPVPECENTICATTYNGYAWVEDNKYVHFIIIPSTKRCLHIDNVRKLTWFSYTLVIICDNYIMVYDGYSCKQFQLEGVTDIINLNSMIYSRGDKIYSTIESYSEYNIKHMWMSGRYNMFITDKNKIYCIDRYGPFNIRPLKLRIRYIDDHTVIYMEKYYNVIISPTGVSTQTYMNMKNVVSIEFNDVSCVLTEKDNSTYLVDISRTPNIPIKFTGDLNKQVQHKKAIKL